VMLTDELLTEAPSCSRWMHAPIVERAAICWSLGTDAPAVGMRLAAQQVRFARAV
jgi:hypothetical protein